MLLAGCLSALCGGLAVELAATGASDDPKAATRARASSRPVASGASDATAAAARRVADIDRWVATILARPPLDPARRPPNHEAGPVVARGGPEGPPRLTGVMISPEGRVAFFAPEGAKPAVVKEGAQIGRWTVRAIEAGQVTLVGPDGTHKLHPALVPGRNLVVPAAAQATAG